MGIHLSRARQILRWIRNGRPAEQGSTMRVPFISPSNLSCTCVLPHKLSKMHLSIGHS